ncbi:MAG: patatin-like phospholipase family protein [Moraxella sp.]|nr:patatin-like phospholipase family protein [Moraxella sp.]
MKKPYFLAMTTAVMMAGCASTQTAPSTTQTAPKAPTPTAEPSPKVALVLGGGGTRGYAHIGAIKALEEHGISPDLVVGTSAGAMVGAIYASGKSAAELERIANAVNEIDLLDIAPSKQGLIEGTALRDFINTQVNHTPIEKLPRRFAAVATDAQSKATVTFRQGDTGLAVQASSSIPNLFIAPRIPAINGKKYIDGGQVALLPSAIAKSMGAQMVIAVDVMASLPTTKPKATKQPSAGISRTDTGVKAVWGDDIIELPINTDAIHKATKDLPISIDMDKLLGMIPANTTINLPNGLPTSLPKSKDDFMQMANGIFMKNAKKATPADIKASDILIQPKLSEYAVFDGSQKDEIIQAGYTATLAQIPQIKAAIAKQHTTKQIHQ